MSCKLPLDFKIISLIYAVLISDAAISTLSFGLRLKVHLRRIDLFHNKVVIQQIIIVAAAPIRSTALLLRYANGNRAYITNINIVPILTPRNNDLALLTLE